jgi:hypothetical protein
MGKVRKKSKPTQIAITKRNVTRPPLVVNKKALPKPLQAKVLDPKAEAWLEQLTTVFERKGQLQPMPLFEDQFPCPTTMAVNYATTNFTITAGNQMIDSWHYPCGVPIGGAAGDDANKPLTGSAVTSAAASVGKLGPILQTATVNGWPALWQYQPEATAMNDYALPSACLPTVYEALSSPFYSGATGAAGQATGEEFRTAAYGVRITYMSKLADTEGYVEHYAPAEYPSNLSAVSAYSRRDQAYRINYFGVKKSFCYFWTPNCDEIPFSLDVCDSALSNQRIPSRFAIRVGGLTEGEKIRMEIICVQEWTGAKAVATQIPRTLTPDSTHVTNALTVHRGAQHDQEEGGVITRGVKLSHLAAGHKAIAHPLWRQIVDHAPAAIEDFKKVAEAGKKVGKALFALLAS